MRCGRAARYILIGDYIDRGPDTRKVVDLLMHKQLGGAGQFICLRGNHEQMLIAAARQDRSDRDLMNWWTNGGEQTLDSYGCDDPSSLPSSHLGWIETLPLKARDQKRLFVHAGIRPGIPTASQSEHDLLWIREPFLSSEIPHESFVVHAPTGSRLPDLRPNRLNIDTGACFGGELTTAAFTEEQVGPTYFVNSRGNIW